MTLINQESSVTYNGNGVTTQWPFLFIIPSNSQKVGLFDIATSVLTELDPSDYSITGLDDPNGGTVDYPLSGAPITSAKRLVIWRDLGYTQDTDLTNQTPFYPEVLENQLDRIVMQIQQLAADSERAIKVTLGSNLTPDQFVADLQQGAADAQQSASNALASELKAQKWAENPEDVPVETGKYSAYHWAAKASAVSSITSEIIIVAGMQSEIASIVTDKTQIDAVAANLAHVEVNSLNMSSIINVSNDIAAVNAVNNALPILIDTATVLNAVVRHDVAQVLGASAQGQARKNIGAASRVDTRRNRIVNGDMRMSQEFGVQARTDNGSYPVDQWAQYFVTSAGTLTVQQVASVTPAGSPNRLRATVTTADASLAAGEYWTLTQNLEGSNVVDFQYGGAAAKASVLRFGFKGPAGTYAVALHNSAANRSFVALFTIDAPDANVDTVQNIAIPGDTTGTWLTADGVIGITLDIVLAAGSTFQGTTGWQAGNILGTSAVSNGMGTGGAVFELFDVGLRLDPDATGVYGQYEVGDVHPVYRAERYCWKRYFGIGDRLAIAAIVTASQAEFNYTLPVEPAKEPAMVVVGDWTLNVNASGTTANIPTTLSLQASVSDILWLRGAVSGASAGQAGQIRAGTAGSIFFNARLS